MKKAREFCATAQLNRESPLRPSPHLRETSDSIKMALEARFWRYDSRVLMPDWHEDAVAAPHKDTKRRVTPPSGFQSDYSRASQEVGVPGEVSTGAKPRRRMVTTQNFSAQISQPRRTELRPTVGGFDATLTRGASFEEERTTTFQRFHVLAPERAKRGPAPPEKGRRRTRGGWIPRTRQPRASGRRGVQHQPRVLHQERHRQGLPGQHEGHHELGIGHRRSVRSARAAREERGGGGVQERTLGVGG